jgi:hypothetical protein
MRKSRAKFRAYAYSGTSALPTFNFIVLDEVTGPIDLEFPTGLVTSSTTMNPKL